MLQRGELDFHLEGQAVIFEVFASALEMQEASVDFAAFLPWSLRFEYLQTEDSQYF